MTPTEIDREFEHIYETRIAILTQGERTPTKIECDLAREEAFQAIENMKKEINEND